MKAGKDQMQTHRQDVNTKTQFYLLSGINDTKLNREISGILN